MTDSLLLQVLAGVSIGLGAGYVGSFMVLRRMSLVGDALSHVALPGIAIAILLNINPFVGAFGALMLAVFGIWFLEKKTSLPSETLVGIFFTLSLAVGILITPEPELLEALFGDLSTVGFNDLIVSVISVLLIIAIISKISKSLMLGILSKELTQSMGIGIGRVNFIFLALVSLIVALGLKVAGTLLMGALVIIPAAAAKNVSRSLSGYTLTSMVFGGLAALIGILLTNYWNLASPGPLVVLSGGVIFLITFIFKKSE